MRANRRIDFVDALGTGGALLFIFCLYTSPAHLWPWSEVFRPALLAAVMMLAALGLRRVVRQEPLRYAGALGGAMTCLFALLALSGLWALEASRANTFATESLKLLLAFVGLATALRTPRHVRVAMLLAVAAAVIPAQGTISRWRSGTELVEGYRAAWIGLLENPNQLAMVMALTAPWALAFAVKARGPRRLLLLTAFGLLATTVVLTHSRGGALGLAVSVGAWAALARQRTQAIAITLAAAFAVVFFAPSSFWSRTETIAFYEQDASALGRLRSWEAGSRAIEDHPFLGVGGDNYLLAWNKYMPRNQREHAYTAHNTLMQVLVELGALGLILFVTMYGAGMTGLWRARNGDLADESRALLASLAGLLVCGATGGYAFNWFFYMALGLAGAIISQQRLSQVGGRVHAAVVLA